VIDAHEISLGIDLLFFFEGLVVTTERNAVEIDITGFKNLTGIDILTLRHGNMSPYVKIGLTGENLFKEKVLPAPLSKTFFGQKRIYKI
jgi:hypothetical protein